jgi:hypothetical protein
MVLAGASDVDGFVARSSFLCPRLKFAPVTAFTWLSIRNKELVAVIFCVVQEVIRRADDVLAKQVKAVLDMVIGYQGLFSNMRVIGVRMEKTLNDCLSPSAFRSQAAVTYGTVQSMIPVGNIHAFVNIPRKYLGTWKSQAVCLIMCDGYKPITDIDCVPHSVLFLKGMIIVTVLRGVMERDFHFTFE